MSREVDERIVSMQFDSKQFEANVRSTISAIDKLKESLRFTGATEGLNNIDNASRRVNMSGLSNAIEGVKSKFSAMEVVAITTLANITNQAINAGKRIASALTIQPISTGFSEYETYIGAVQTIYANTRAREKEVTDGVMSSIDSVSSAATSAAKTTATKSNKEAVSTLKAGHKEIADSFDAMIKKQRDSYAENYKKNLQNAKNAYKEELEACKNDHNAKLKLYNEEYMAKLRVVNEEKYNKLKAIDDQIQAIRNTTKAEQEAIEEAEQARQLETLEKRVTIANTLEEQKLAEKRLADFKDSIARKKLLKERDAQIDSLELAKDGIEKEYEPIIESINKEYDEKLKRDAEAYDEKIARIDDAYNRSVEHINDIYDRDIEMLNKRYSEEHQRMDEKLNKELEILEEQNQKALSNISTQKNATIGAIGEVKKVMTKEFSMQEILGGLDELNEYADNTIYNFPDMAKNIGTFTAAGVDFDVSVDAIKGIANLAALSGSSAQQASVAMYQLSQAMASGTVKLQDWNSVVNAGMGGAIFQDSLKETAKAHGIAVDEIIKKEGSFRNSLSTGWLSTEILTETLSKFTGDLTESQLESMGYNEKQIEGILELGKNATDAATKVRTFSMLMDTAKESAQSGWAETWRIIFGDFDEATDFWSEMNQMLDESIGKSAEERNNLLFGGLSTGFKQLIKEGELNESKFIDAILQESKRLGVSLDYDKYENDSKAFKDSLKDGWLTTEILTNALGSMTDEVSSMSEEQLKEAGYTDKQINGLIKLNENIKKGSVNLDEFSEAMAKPSGRENLIDALKNSIEAIRKVIQPIKDAFREIFPKKTADDLYKFTERIKEFTEKLIISDDTADKLKRTFKGVFAIFDILGQAAKAIWDAIKPLFGGLSDLGDGALGVTANIGDFLVALADGIRENNTFGTAIQKLIDFFTPLVDVIKLGAEGVWNFIKGIGEKFSFPGFEDFSNFMSGLQSKSDGVKGTVTNIKDTVVNAVTELGEKIKNSKLYKLLKKVWEVIKTIGKAIGQAIGGVVSNVADKFAEADLGDIAKFLGGLSLAGLTKNVAELVKTLKKPAKAISKVLGELRGVLEAYQKRIKADALKKIATAVAILVAAIAVLALLPQDKALAGVGIIIALFTQLQASFKIIVGIDRDLPKVSATLTTLLGIATSVLLLAGALEKIGELKIEEALQGFVGVVGLMSMIGVFINSVDSTKTLDPKTGASLILIAVALRVLAGACKKMGDMSDTEMGKGLFIMGALIAGVAVLNAAVDNEAKKLLAGGAAMLMMAKAMKKVAGIIKDFGDMDIDELGLAVGGFVSILGAMVGAIKLVPKDAPERAAGLLILSGAMVLIGKALSDIGGMSWADLGAGLVGMGVGLYELVKAVNSINKKKILEKCEGLALLSASMVLLGAGLAIIGSLSLGELIIALAGLAATLTIFGTAVKMLEGKEDTMLALGNSLLGMGAGIALVGVGLLAAGIGLTAIAAGMIALGGAAVVAGAGVVAFLKTVIVGIAGIIPDLIVIGGEIIVALCDVIIEAAPKVAEALIALLSASITVLSESATTIAEGFLGFIDKFLDVLLKYIPGIADKIFKILIEIINVLADNVPELVTAIVELLSKIFGAVLDCLANSDTETILTNLLSIGLIGGIVEVLNAIKSKIPGAMIAAGELTAFIAELSLIIAAIGAIAQIPGLTWLIEEGGALLKAIGEAIGGFIGGFIGSIIDGVIEGISSALPQLGADLSAFMENAKGFIEGANSIQPGAMDGVFDLIGVILALTAANFLDGIASFFSGESSLVKFGEELPKLADGLSAFATKTAGITKEGVDGAVNAALLLSEMADKLPKDGGLFSIFTGNTDIVTFAKSLPPLGVSLKEFAKEVDGISEESVSGAANAALVLSEMAENLPSTGGIVEWFTGENMTLTDFGKELESFGPHLMEFASEVEGLNTEVVSSAANSAKVLSEMAKNLPNQGGIVSWFTGENSLEKFGEELAAFGPNLKQFADDVEGLDTNVVEAASNSAKVLSEMAANLPNQGGVVSWFTGDNSLKTFGEELASFGPHLKSYAESVSGLDKDVVDNSVNAAKSLSGLAENLPNSGGIASWFSGDNDIETFGKQLEEFGESFYDYYKQIEPIDSAKLTVAATEFGKLVDLAGKCSDIDMDGISDFSDGLSELAEVGITKFIEQVDNSETKITNAGKKVVEFFIKGVSEKLEDAKTAFFVLMEAVAKHAKANKTLFEEPGKDIITEFSTAISGQTETVKTTIGTLITAIIDKIAEYEPTFHTSGLTLMSKVKSGMSDERTPLTNACSSLVKAMIAKFKEYKGSKASTNGDTFYEAGSNLVSGFVNGIKDNEYKAINAAIDMAKAALEGAEKELDEHSPSKKFYKIGDFAGQGFVNALSDYSKVSYAAGEEMGGSAINGLNAAIVSIADMVENDIDTQPTIRPVLDLSNVTDGARRLNAMFSNDQAISISSSRQKALEEIQNGEVGAKHISFTQNNYSPKALSRAEIYRQTKNQFSMMERMV